MVPKMAMFDAKSYDRMFFETVLPDVQREITFLNRHLSPQTVYLAEGHNAVCAFVNDVVDADTLKEMKSYGIRLLLMRCAGFDRVDMAAANANDIVVLRVPAYSPYAVAEHALALLQTVNRKLHKAHLRTREFNFSIRGLVGIDLYGKTAGVIGVGKIGQIMIHILKGLGMEVLAYDPFPRLEVADEMGFRYVERDELFRSSDVITIHAQLTPETQHMINADAISKMKDGVLIVNVARGKHIDTKALIAGLESEKIRGVGLDVYEEESAYFFEDYSSDVIKDAMLRDLLSFNNVVISGHQAFLTEEALTNIASTTIQNMDDFFHNRPLANQVKT